MTSLLGLGRSRDVVLKLSGLFALDSFAGGFVVQSFAAYWFYLRFGVNPGTLGVIFFWANVFAGVSALLASRLAARFGLVKTMVFTHLPSNILLLLVPLMPTLPLAILVLLARLAARRMGRSNGSPVRPPLARLRRVLRAARPAGAVGATGASPRRTAPSRPPPARWRRALTRCRACRAPTAPPRQALRPRPLRAAVLHEPGRFPELRGIRELGSVLQRPQHRRRAQRGAHRSPSPRPRTASVQPRISPPSPRAD